MALGLTGASVSLAAPAASAAEALPASDAGRLPPYGPVGVERVTIGLGTLDVPGFLRTGPLVASVDQVPASPGQVFTTARLQGFAIRTLDGRVSIRTAIAQIGHVGPVGEISPYLPVSGHYVAGDGSWEAVPPGLPGYLYSRPQYRIAVFPATGTVEVVARVPAVMASRTAVRGLFTGLDPAYLSLIVHAMWPDGPPAPVTYAANDPWLGMLDPGAAEWPGAEVPGLTDVVTRLVPLFVPMLDRLTHPGGTPSAGALPAVLTALAPGAAGLPAFVRSLLTPCAAGAPASAPPAAPVPPTGGAAAAPPVGATCSGAQTVAR